MALSPSEIDEIKASGQLKLAVAAAVLDVANDVFSESSATSNHAARIALAKAVIQASDNMRDEFISLLLSRVSATATLEVGVNPNSATPDDIGLSQPNVKTEIANGWNLFIDV